MALLESGRPRGDILPPIKQPDFEKSRSEKSDLTRFSIMPPLSISTAPLGSPTTMYSGPPPPYSCASSATESIHGLSNHYSPPMSITRRTTRDDKDLSSAKTLPSLPSLHEALGGGKSGSFSGPPSAIQSNAPGSTPTTSMGQTFPDAPMGPPNPFSHTASSASLTSGFSQSDSYTSKAATTTVTGQESGNYPSQPYSSSPQMRNSTHRHSSGSFSSVNRPFEQPNNNSSFPAETTSRHNQPREHPSQALTPQPHSSFKFEPVAKFDDSRNPFSLNNGPTSYGETVKRHLDVFDAELALNEITEASGRTFDFSRSWAQRYHQSNRSSYFAETAPSVQEIDEMLGQQHRILENLGRIREVVIMQQTALTEQRARAARGHMEDDYHGAHEDYKTGGFANGDAKKRRGKAAPPGRCHSCNRAETPEWRRGPDGARTLCNACGLHYAKLTRKLGANKASALTGSSLRPKGLDTRPTHI